MHRTRMGERRATVAVALLALCGSSAVRAEAGATASEAAVPRRQLDGHLFIPSRFSVDPFVATYVGSETGFGYGWAPGRTFDVNGNPVSTATYQVGAFIQNLDYQYGVTEWWAVRASLRVTVFTGVNTPGVVAVGTSISGTPSLGTTMSWKIGEELRLGGSLEFSFGPSIFFNIAEAFRDSQQAGEIVSPVNSFSQWTLRPSVVGAWAINRALGLTFSLTFTYQKASNDNVSVKPSLLTTNLLFDFDMNKLNWVPIGLLAGFTTSYGVADVDFIQFRYQFGIFYTAVTPLTVGLEIVYNRAPVVGNTNIFLSSLIGLIALQYDFN